MKISVVIPIYNESKNIPILFEQIQKALAGGYPDHEVIAINDGSRDDSWNMIRSCALKNQHIKGINFRYNSGQTAALSAGISTASGDIIVPIDSDLENDPADIPKLISKLGEGFDVVSGWRKDRWGGSALTRKLPSIIANWLISKVTELKLHDYGCTLKAYKREIIADVQLYGEMHRFIPAYAFWKGARVTEMPVNYRERIHGASNYGISRTFHVLLDLVFIKFLAKYMNRPIHFFGGIGFTSFLIGILAFGVAIVLKLFSIRDFVQTPLPVFSTLLIIIGVQMIVMGVLAEMIMRTYYESQKKMPYSIQERINF